MACQTGHKAVNEMLTGKIYLRTSSLCTNKILHHEKALYQQSLCTCPFQHRNGANKTTKQKNTACNNQNNHPTPYGQNGAKQKHDRKKHHRYDEAKTSQSSQDKENEQQVVFPLHRMANKKNTCPVRRCCLVLPGKCSLVP